VRCQSKPRELKQTTWPARLRNRRRLTWQQKSFFAGSGINRPTNTEVGQPLFYTAAAIAIVFTASVFASYGKDNGQAAIKIVRLVPQSRNEPGSAAAIKRPLQSCCDNGDVFRTRFRAVSREEDGWEYLKDGVWHLIPPDIIKDEPSLDNEPLLFINRSTGEELCFFKHREGSNACNRRAPLPQRTEARSPQGRALCEQGV